MPLSTISWGLRLLRDFPDKSISPFRAWISPILVKTIFELISALNEQKATILLVEQNIRQALKIAHQAYVLKTGKIVMSGRGDELLADEEIRKAYIGERVSKR